MEYDLKKAVQRFQWRFRVKDGKYLPFNPTELDVEALNTLIGWINRQKKESLNNNVLFAKLFIYYKTQFIRNNETTVLDGFSTKELCRLLDTPLELFYEAFYNDLHDNQLNRLLKTDNKEEELQIIEDYKNYKKTFTKKYVCDKLAYEITEALNRLNNK